MNDSLKDHFVAAVVVLFFPSSVQTSTTLICFLFVDSRWRNKWQLTRVYTADSRLCWANKPWSEWPFQTCFWAVWVVLVQKLVCITLFDVVLFHDDLSLISFWLCFAAKNIALAGVKSLTLHDTKPATWFDLGTNFYLSPQDIGKNRVEQTIKQIAELNPYTRVSANTADLKSVDLSYFDQFKVSDETTTCPLLNPNYYKAAHSCTNVWSCAQRFSHSFVGCHSHRYPSWCANTHQRLLSHQRHSLHFSGRAWCVHMGFLRLRTWVWDFRHNRRGEQGSARWWHH